MDTKINIRVKQVREIYLEYSISDEKTKVEDIATAKGLSMGILRKMLRKYPECKKIQVDMEKHRRNNLSNRFKEEAEVSMVKLIQGFYYEEETREMRVVDRTIVEEDGKEYKKKDLELRSIKIMKRYHAPNAACVLAAIRTAHEEYADVVSVDAAVDTVNILMHTGDELLT